MKGLKKFALTILMLTTFNITKAQIFSNPILSGFYPYPNIRHVGKDYYIVNSSFAYYQGLRVFHNIDLAKKQQILQR